MVGVVGVLMVSVVSVMAVPVAMSLHGAPVDALAALAGRAAASGTAAATRRLRHHLVDVDGRTLVDATTSSVVDHQRLGEKQARANQTCTAT